MDSEVSHNGIWVGLAVTTLSLIAMWKIMTTKKYNLPPGPKGWPVIGNLHDMAKNPYPTVLLEKYRKEYGDVFTFYLGLEPVVVLNSLQSIREALVEKQNEYAGRPKNHSIDIVSEGGKSMIFADFTEIWKIQRKIAFSVFKRYASGQQLENLLHESFENLTAVLETHKGAIDPLDVTSHLVYNIIFQMTCGKKTFKTIGVFPNDFHWRQWRFPSVKQKFTEFRETERSLKREMRWELRDPLLKKVIDIVDDQNATFGLNLLADFIPILKYIPTKKERRLKEGSAFIKLYLTEVMDQHRKNFDPDNLADLCDFLISCEKDAEAEHGNEIMKQMDELHYVYLLWDIIEAATDTSRYTLLWLFIYITRNPECQSKIQEEIDRVIGTRLLTITDKSKLHYTNAVLHKVMRIRTIVPFAIPHKTTCDTTVGQYTIPKGTQVWPNFDALHHNEANWNNPEKFDPSRFLDEDGKFTGIPPSFKPFGTGRRVCVGESLAKTELLILTAMFFQKFSVSSPDDTLISDDFLPETLFIMPKPCKMIFKCR